MIRVEVTNEADVTRMVAAFQVLPVLRDSDYEIWLAGPTLASQPWGAGCVKRAWREDGLRGATEPTDWGDGGASGGPGRPYLVGGTCATCGKPIPGGGHAPECTGLAPGSECIIGAGGAADA